MAAKYIITAVAGSAAIAYVCDQRIADKKIFGGNLFFYLLLLAIAFKENQTYASFENLI